MIGLHWLDDLSLSLVGRQNRSFVRGRFAHIEMYVDQHVDRRLDIVVAHAQRVLRHMRLGPMGHAGPRFGRRRRWTDIETHHDVATHRLSVRSSHGPAHVLGERQRGGGLAAPLPGRARHQALSGRVRRADHQGDLAVRVGPRQELFASLGRLVSVTRQARRGQVPAPTQVAVLELDRVVACAQCESQGAYAQDEQCFRLEFVVRGSWYAYKNKLCYFSL